MTLPQIDQLTPEQEALIPVYLDKWRKIAFSTEPINQEQAANSVKAAYAAERCVSQDERKLFIHQG